MTLANMTFICENLLKKTLMMNKNISSLVQNTFFEIHFSRKSIRSFYLRMSTPNFADAGPLLYFLRGKYR